MSSVPNVPGTGDAVEEPTQIDNTLCSEEANAKVSLTYYDTLDRWPLTGDDFVLFWTVCNEGKQTVAAGQSYALVIDVQTINTQTPSLPTETQVGTPTVIPIPALAPCVCYTQEVGINIDVSQTAQQQQNVQGLGASFPRINLGANSPQQGNIVFNYLASLSSATGLSVPNTLTFAIN
jgi:hypothetical protein